MAQHKQQLMLCNPQASSKAGAIREVRKAKLNHMTLDELTKVAFHARHDTFQNHLFKLEQAITGFSDPQYTQAYHKARKDITEFFSNINTRLAYAEQKTINKAQAKSRLTQDNARKTKSTSP